MATVPNVVGVSFLTALAALAGTGLVTTYQQTYSSSVASGLVISQNPAAASSVALGTNVIATVSAGVAPVAGNGYDKWGKTGGGVTAANEPTPLGQNLATAAHPANAIYVANQSVMAALANGGIPLSQATPDYLVPYTPTVGAPNPAFNPTSPYVYWRNSSGSIVAWVNSSNAAVDWT